MKMEDSDGNKLYFGDDGVYLQNKGKARLRKIFTFSYGKIYKFLKKASIMQNKLVGFNYKALQQLWLNSRIKDKTIYIIFGKKRYSVTIQEVLERKQFMHFKEQGFETQVFFPFELMKEIKL